MVLLTGPRQVGKTYLSRQLMDTFKHPMYLNFDDIHHARVIRNKNWPLETDYLVLDELHKMKNWKSFLKGTYDTKAPFTSILVTGSARMETFRQGGESLAGRYLKYRLHPLTVRELSSQMPAQEALRLLNQIGGFPEPFLSGSDQYASRWRNQYFTDIIREDILDFSRIQEINAMRLLVELLRDRIGSPLSLSSIAQDIQVSPHTVNGYIAILESLYIVFLIRPFHKNIARSILKEPKLYLFDAAYGKGDEGIKLENSVACCLLRHAHYQQDVFGKDIKIQYLRTKDKREVDFIITEDDRPIEMVEVKLTDRTPSRHLRYFKQRYPHIRAVQIVQNLRDDIYISDEDIYIRNAGNYLAELSG